MANIPLHRAGAAYPLGGRSIQEHSGVKVLRQLGPFLFKFFTFRQ
jgi:hypothetical protein